MARRQTIVGMVSIVQEGRFQLTDRNGVSRLFILGASAAVEPAQLQALQRTEAWVCVQYDTASNVIGHTATALYKASRKDR